MRRSGTGTKEEMEALLKELENAPEELLVQHVTAPESSLE